MSIADKKKDDDIALEEESTKITTKEPEIKADSESQTFDIKYYSYLPLFLTINV
jgi:hypothetical protein